jgi:hypothetical protein
MKKLFAIIVVIVGSLNLGFSQVTSIPADRDINPEDSLKIFVDLSGLEVDENLTRLLEAVDEGLDLYIWTWKPIENRPPLGDDMVDVDNGVWNASNEALKMKKESDLVYSYSMIPTEFYGVEASEVYKEDISLLVKPKDGGGFGNPDIKTQDLLLKVDPPELGKLYAIPFSKVQKDDYFVLNYNNVIEDKSGMQSIDPDDVYFSAFVTSTDSVQYVKVGILEKDESKLAEVKMEQVEPGLFRKVFIPEQFFEGTLPAGKEIMSMRIIVRKKTWNGVNDQIDPVVFPVGCN